MRTIGKLVLLVGGSMLVAVLGLYVVHRVVPADVLRANNDVAGNYLQTLGTIYAVLLAFVVFVVWSQYNDACKIVELEADALADVLRFVRICPEPARSRMLEAARDFAREQIENEWPCMASGVTCSRVGQHLESFWQLLATTDPRNSREEALYNEAIARFNEICDARTDVLQSSRTRLPPTMRALIITGGCGTVGSMYLFGLDRFWPLALMTASLAGCVSFVLFVIFDLDNPFNGDWQVRPEPIQVLREQLEKEIIGQVGDVSTK